MRALLIILILFHVKFATSASLTIAVVPPGISIYPDMRRAIGHVTTIIDCGSTQRSTSISTSLLRGPYIQSTSETRIFLHRYRSSAKYYTFWLNDKSCENIVAFDDFYREYSGLEFSPFLDPLKEYLRAQKGMPATPGGTGASYAVGFLKLIGAKIDFENCKESFLGHRFETARSMIKCLSKSSGGRIP